ncbi:cobalamin biosynthesis protein [Stappia sp. GBMRC 2046]|uniref:Cobalamin biosynthesis protein CobD n=1 Tax=Stappia sediminis TaxID=2692190 RepID=A0A7X3LXU3_9HYPH|nr:CobD/CbiB family cobalamin biosynthesis protein [Stappia sediminis]MXN67092.1 cobalamin biosynthesis protein [Stappia sediminis]
MLLFPDVAALLLAALLLDAALGDPDWLWRRLPHPVALFGAVISIADQDFNTSDLSPRLKKTYGTAFLAALVAVSFALGLLIEGILRLIPYGEIGIVLIAAIFLAQRSLYDHVARVRDSLARHGLEHNPRNPDRISRKGYAQDNDSGANSCHESDPAFVESALDAARREVAMIVGRDPDLLDEAGVSRASIESCSENFSDGIVAPALWFLLLGLPGLMAYKAVNTADSMVGHKTERHRDFGWASARFDDLVNLPASRLAGFFIAFSAPLARGSIANAFKVMMADAPRHRSPNAGWPEAAMAGALDLALAGPRRYRGYAVEDPFMNEKGRREADADDITRALRVYCGACAIQAAVVGVVAAL